MADHPIMQAPAQHLAQWLLSRTNQQLTEILQARDDAGIPEPRDMHTLAHRLLLPASLARALEQRNAAELAVLEALLTAGAHTQPVSHDQLLAAVRGTQLDKTHADNTVSATSSISSDSADSDSTTSADTSGSDTNSALSHTLHHLHSTALVLSYPTDDAQAVSYWVPARIHSLLSHRDRLLHQRSVSPDTIAALPEKHQEILRRIHAGGGLGTTKHADNADPEHPISQMIASGLLYRVADATVALPVAVARILSGVPATEVQLLPSARIAPALWDDITTVLTSYGTNEAPQTSASNRTIATNPAGTAAGLEACREISDLLDCLGEQPVSLLKNGGLGQRSTKQLSQRLGISPHDVERTVAIAHAAGLVGTGEPKPLPADGEGNCLAPTRRADDWHDADLATRWSTVLRGWLDSPWPWWQVSSGTEAQQRLLHPEFSAHRLPAFRRLALHTFARSSAETPTSELEFWQDALFLHPKQITPASQPLLTPLLREAEWVGAINDGVLTAPAVALLLDDATTQSGQRPEAVLDPESSVDPVTAAAQQLCPAPVSEFIVQADFTIMCPGPLEPAVRTELELCANMESPGLASLYRLEESSVRRSLDAGRSGEQIVEFLRNHSLTPMPDGMISVIRDLARHHGGLRGGPAVSYLRCEDPATLDVLEHSAVAAELSIHRIAPTVVISQRTVAFVVKALAQHGFYAVAEDSNGHGVDIRHTPARVPLPRAKAASAPRLHRTRIAAIVDKLTAGAPEVHTDTSPAEISNVIELAQRSRRTVVLGYATKSGQRKQVRAQVLSIFGGNVDIRVRETGSGDGLSDGGDGDAPDTHAGSGEQVRRIPLHRIIDITQDD